MGRKETCSEALLAAAQGGDRAALEELLRLHRDGVYRYGLQVCRTTEDAEDAVQMTLWAATRSISAFRRASSVSTWLFTIVRNYCHRMLEHGYQKRALEPVRDSLPDPRPLADEEFDAGQLRALLVDSLARLDPLYREVIVLRDVQGLTAPEAAEALNITIPALKSRLLRGREQLRQLVELQPRLAT